MGSVEVMSAVADDSKKSCNGYSLRYASTMNGKSHTSCELKIFCDPVHGQIALHPVCVSIIDTPQFQRLRHIKQTGLLDFVYPGATHNRFGHCIGVCYLAGKFIHELRDRQSDLNITDTDVLCIQIAGLCHDLGHGPFSHTWDSFIKESSIKRGVKCIWKHEMVSANMLDYLIEENNLWPMLHKYGIGPDDVNLIKDYITGAQPKDAHKAFLYQIVNNEDSGLDVDKWDYFLRDCYYLGLRCSFEYERLMQCARVFIVDGRSQICFRDKVLDSVYNVFCTRGNLHRLAYQHRIVTIADKMLVDAFLLSEGKVKGPSGELLNIWEWSMCAAFGHGEKLRHALEKFCILTDSVMFNCLRYSNKPDLQPASTLIKSLEIRSAEKSGFYQHIAVKTLPFLCAENDILDGLCGFLPSSNNGMIGSVMKSYYHEEGSSTPVTKDDICVCVVRVHWGKGSQNPVDFVHFYSKNSPFTINTLDHLEVSALLPKTFEEIQIHFLCRRNDSYAKEVLRQSIEKYWCSIKDGSL